METESNMYDGKANRAMNAFIYIRSTTVASVDKNIYESLQATAKQKGWQATTVHIDQTYEPLFYKSGVCAIFEVMKHCECSVLLVASADQLSIHPNHLMEFNALLCDYDMKVYLQLEQQYLNDWVYDFKLLEA